MIQFTFYQKNPSSHYVYIEMDIAEVTTGKLELQLPSWRPGRYELGNFAKNIKRLEVFDQAGKPVKFQKETKDKWVIESSGCQSLKVTYSYYATELNAGACYADENQIYINPVHCCFYIPGRESEEQQVIVNSSYKDIASSMNRKDNRLVAENYEELTESPFIVSDKLVSRSFIVDNVTFYLHFNGDVHPDWERLEKDFVPFIRHQFKFWGSFPFKEYHFLFQITPHKFYHGVEHFKNTVIALGPDTEVFATAMYNELLGVSCHELFHVWNIKTIRPVEMMPYDLTRENYSKSGFVYEGFTTYYGDKNLFSSGVFNETQYFETLEDRMNRHFQNYGRYNLGVADSSWDTWLDGYIPGAPYRKTNIYTEGNLVAFMLDILIMKGSENKYCLKDVCVELYNEFGKKKTGYSYENIIALCEKYAKISLRGFFETYVEKANDFEQGLVEQLDYLGLKIEKVESLLPQERYFGFKTSDVGTFAEVTLVAPYSPSWNAGLFDKDQIIAVNSIVVRNNLSSLLNHFIEEEITLTIIRNERVKSLKMKKDEGERTYYWRARLVHLSNKGQLEKLNFDLWKLDFIQ